MNLVAHVSRTPCAGAIYALSTACSAYSAPSRAISCGGQVGNLSFPNDLTWRDAEALSVLALANVIVLHNYLDVDDQPIFDFLEGDPTKRVAVFFHSHPDNCNLVPVSRGVPVYVVNQFQSEAFAARGIDHVAVRNVIRFDHASWPTWKDRDPHKFKVGYSPTTRNPQGPPGTAAFYDTKGYDVTMPVLDAFGSGSKSVEIVPMEGVQWHQAIRWKAECDVLVDEVVTGSFHRSTLEALALGVPVIVKMDPALDRRITEAAEGDEMPVVRCNGPDDLGARLEKLARMTRKDRRQLGVAGREWMERHWHPREIAREFARTLDKLPTWESLRALPRRAGEDSHGSRVGLEEGCTA